MTERALECCTPLGSATITDAEAASTAELFKALAHPQRVKILNLLAVNGAAMCVLDIATTLELPQPNASHHLKLLSRAGLLTRQQCGTWAYYGLNHEVLERLSAVTAVTRPAAALGA
ncbi:ArsR/SmtB family transcription factor [Nonomuraea endophytica]|uniref:ArsR/SmtB family transcription factor n=1 Tax=Nonomuraea endophytica TaxID=714136 RepID=UPI0037C96073